MKKKGSNEPAMLSEDWDTDPSASDNESFEIEMMQNDSIEVPGTKRGDSKEKTNE
ncbi:hypothetical protein [Peribacillus asahii]|uniref:Uncharacterized protein n=1 Tax=Peribacillus asahii TaxID=228899 RepID=A0A3Q9RJR0_9BACI|nr:hypothetical protein [Peribacillus asahii]AZV43240.1 hypothetical protein BAOM_2631 [Peribacillus asahii]USK83315.1 hypothetical protein LIT35_12545 [Peribacillus asahii]